MTKRTSAIQECCPACGRAFRRISDYPTVRILEFERLPIPEAIDRMSGAASSRRAEADRAGRPDAWNEGINMTPQIGAACEQEHVQRFLERLQELEGTEVDPSCLNPPWEPHGCDGINFGSGGGPTLQRLRVIARIRYEGLLTRPNGDSKSGESPPPDDDNV